MFKQGTMPHTQAPYIKCLVCGGKRIKVKGQSTIYWTHLKELFRNLHTMECMRGY